jgi:hypothetical protein
MSKSRLLSGKIKKRSGTELDTDRYDYLDLSNAEPDLGLPVVDNSVLIGDIDGTRTWTDITTYANDFKGYTGSQGDFGYTGSQGDFGYTGSQGPQGNFGGVTFDYTFSTDTDNSEPGAGKLKVNQNDITTATTLYIQDTDDNNVNLDAYLTTIDASTSQLKGHIRISNKANSDDFAIFAITSNSTNNSTYFTVPISYVSGSASSFSNNEDIIVTFARTGDKGDIGYTGSQGDIGYTGSAGTDGFVGADGAPGFTGSQGDIGYTGSQGDIGYTGSQGIQGFTGSQGDIGYTGSQGIQGFTGSSGTDGIDGTSGVDGYTGSQGDIGYTGSQGDIGYTGSQGDTGFVGSQGDIGYTGSQGDIGYTGSKGDGLDEWIRITSNYTAESGNRIIADTTAAGFTITLPSSPELGYYIVLTDGGDWSINPLIISAGSSSIEGYNEDVIIDIGGVTTELLWDGSMWQITATIGAAGSPGIGVPDGGTTGQVLTKISNTDYDADWVDPTGGGGGGADSYVKTYFWEGALQENVSLKRFYIHVASTLEAVTINLGTAGLTQSSIQIKRNNQILNNIVIPANTTYLTQSVNHQLAINDYLTVDISQSSSAANLYVTLVYRE